MNNHVDVLKELIFCGSNVNARESLGRTALMIAAKHNSRIIVKSLLSAGANPFLKANDGLSAIDLTENHDI